MPLKLFITTLKHGLKLIVLKNIFYAIELNDAVILTFCIESYTRRKSKSASLRGKKIHENYAIKASSHEAYLSWSQC